MQDPYRTAREGDHGRFFDGRTAAAHGVRINLFGDGIDILGERGRSFGRWRFEGMDIERHLDVDREVSLMHGEHPDQRLIITDGEILRRLQGAAPTIFRPRRRRLTVSMGVLQVALVIGIIAAIVFVLVPRTAGVIAGAIPLEWENQWGQGARNMIIGQKRVCTAQAGRQALDALVLRLTGSGGREGPYRIKVTVIDSNVENAVATLGGQVIVFRRLIEKMEGPDEFAGVLAHEIAHVRARHPLTGAVESMTAALLAGLFGTSASDVGGSAAGLGGLLAITSYSRAKEEAADRIAVKLLAEAGISPLGFAKFFERLRASAGGAEPPTILSTHPATADRIARLKAIAEKTLRTTPALAPAQWRALKAICN